MKRLRPFFSYFGSKWQLAPYYPKPVYGCIVEPFAGSACYSLLYPNKDVHLYDASPIICGVWDYLIRSKESEILALPDIPQGASIRDYVWCEEAANLIGFWITKGQEHPSHKMGTGWVNRPRNGRQCELWGAGVRNRITSQLQYTRHWKIKQSCYTRIPITFADTVYVDSPYQVEGADKYPCKLPGLLPYRDLRNWCIEVGSAGNQVIVCESSRSNWMQWSHLKHHSSQNNKPYTEVYWTNVSLFNRSKCAELSAPAQ